MTDKVLERISKSCNIQTPADFDRPDVDWPGLLEWRLEVLERLDILQCAEDKLAEQEQEAREAARLEVAHKKQAEKEEQERIKQMKKGEQEWQRQAACAEKEHQALQAKQVKEEAQRVKTESETHLSTSTPVATSASWGFNADVRPAQPVWPVPRTSCANSCLAIGESLMSFLAPVTPVMRSGQLSSPYSAPGTPLSASSEIQSPVSVPQTPFFEPHPVGTLLVGPEGLPISTSSSQLGPNTQFVLHNQLQLNIRVPPAPSSASSSTSTPALSHNALPMLFATPPQVALSLPEQSVASTSFISATTTTVETSNLSVTQRTKT